MRSKNLYSVLELDRNASAEEIKRAFRRLAKKYHPDQAKGDATAEKRFKEVQAAYAVLSDPKRREQYDRFGTVGPFAEQATGAPGGARVYQWSSGGPDGVEFDLGDLSEVLRGFGIGMGQEPAAQGSAGSMFDDFFRGRRRRRSRVREAQAQPDEFADVEHPVSLSFMDAVRGTTLQLVIPGLNGRATERINVRIPPGVSEGQRVRVRGKGRPTADGGRGDLFIVCHIEPHPYFQRQGDDILLDLPVTLAEAALGAKVDIPTLDGLTTVTIPPGTASGKKLRLAGCGVRNSRTGERGDQYACIRIVPPARLNERQRKLLQELAQTDIGSPREGLW